MRTEYTIKNFRAFDENGVTVKFSPITILTGTNSSGKSSIVKSMVLLDTYRNSLKKNYENNQLESTYTTLNFSESHLISKQNQPKVLVISSKSYIEALLLMKLVIPIWYIQN